MDPLNLNSIPADIKALMDRVDALEARSAADMQRIADQIIKALAPEVQAMVDAVNTLTVTASAAVEEVVNTVRRVDGASVTVKLGEL